MLNYRFWIKFSVANFVLVAVLGFLMRYMMVWPVDVLHQKNILHAHSHFAFAGWISQSLYLFIAHMLAGRIPDFKSRKYNFVFGANILVSYGMLIAFSLQGYALYSIILATLSILIFYFFALFAFQDLRRIRESIPEKKWLIAALAFGILSTLGTFSLAITMASKSDNRIMYLGSLYFYLHFQYNGWFLFACIGLFYNWMHRHIESFRENKFIFYLLTITCIPLFFQSMLWTQLPTWLYSLTTTAAVIQCGVIYYCIDNLKIYKERIQKKVSALCIVLLLIILSCFFLKILLQFGSVLPSLRALAYNHFIVIAYLHLILIGVYSLFIFAYGKMQNLFVINKAFKFGIITLIISFIANELLILMQAFGHFFSVSMHQISVLLLGITIILLAGLLLIFGSQRH